MATAFDRDDGQFDKIEKSDKSSKDDNDVTGRRSCVFLLFLAMFLSCFMGYFVLGGGESGDPLLHTVAIHQHYQQQQSSENKTECDNGGVGGSPPQEERNRGKKMIVSSPTVETIQSYNHKQREKLNLAISNLDTFTLATEDLHSTTGIKVVICCLVVLCTAVYVVKEIWYLIKFENFVVHYQGVVDELKHVLELTKQINLMS